MINILFGTVVSVKDTEKLNRIQVSIPGHTNEIALDDLPWYFPYLGVDYLPIVNDTVSVIIFNDNIVNGFYSNRNISVKTSDLSDSEYENYLEIYKRLGVELTYKESVGIKFINNESHIQIDKEIINIIAKTINHNSGKEPMVLGDTLQKLLEELIDAILKLTVTTPNGPSGTPINFAMFNKVKGKLEQFKSKLSNLE